MGELFKVNMSHFKRFSRKLSKTEPTFCEIKSLLHDFLDKVDRDKKNPVKEIFEKWPEIIGDKFVKWTKPISFENNVLKIKVISSALYSLLVNYEKKRLLTMLRRSFPDVLIRDIQFLIG